MAELSSETTKLLDRLEQLASAPLERSFAAPPEIYHNEEILQLERERVFAQDWVCPGLAAEIPNTGDYLTCR